MLTYQNSNQFLKMMEMFVKQKVNYLHLKIYFITY